MHGSHSSRHETNCKAALLVAAWRSHIRTTVEIRWHCTARSSAASRQAGHCSSRRPGATVGAATAGAAPDAQLGDGAAWGAMPAGNSNSGGGSAAVEEGALAQSAELQPPLQPGQRPAARELRQLLAEPVVVPQHDTCSLLSGDSGGTDGDNGGRPAAAAAALASAVSGFTSAALPPQPSEAKVGSRPPPSGSTAFGDPNLGLTPSPAVDATAMPAAPATTDGAAAASTASPPQQQQQAGATFGYVSPALRGLLPGRAGGGGHAGGGAGAAPPPPLFSLQGSRMVPRHHVPPGAPAPSGLGHPRQPPPLQPDAAAGLAGPGQREAADQVSRLLSGLFSAAVPRPPRALLPVAAMAGACARRSCGDM